jgi:hypothetical protein
MSEAEKPTERSIIRLREKSGFFPRKELRSGITGNARHGMRE